MKLKDASKALGKRFAGASSIKDTPSGEKEIQIQGDWRYDIEDALESLLGIPRKKITVDISTGFKKVKEPKEIAAQPDRGAPP
jgi:translation initiation factor 1 (eIF-1/SUI1)